MKMKDYTVCARAQASIFMFFLPFSQKRNRQNVEEAWTMTEIVVKSEDLTRQTKDWMAVFSQTVWEISKKLQVFA